MYFEKCPLENLQSTDPPSSKTSLHEIILEPFNALSIKNQELCQKLRVTKSILYKSYPGILFSNYLCTS